jgi:hypothetical protein
MVDEEKVQSQLILYCGVMFGVSGAISGVRVLSTQIAKTTLHKLPQKALTKTFWYPLVKQIGKAVGIAVPVALVSASYTRDKKKYEKYKTDKKNKEGKDDNSKK